MIEENMIEVLGTDSYDDFSFHPLNRKIKPAHVAEIVKSIQKKNLLKNCPIIINEEMEIIDGQHRFLAAKKLNIPFYYVVNRSEDGGIVDMLLFNHVNKNWEIPQYVDYYCKLGVESFIQCKRICEKYEVNYSVYFMLTKGYQSSTITHAVKKGKIDTVDEERFSRIINNFNDIKKLIIKLLPYGDRKFLLHERFQKALIVFLRNDNVDAESFKEKLQLKVYSIRTCTCVTDYLRLLENIYNFRLSKSNRINTSYRYNPRNNINLSSSEIEQPALF